MLVIKWLIWALMIVIGWLLAFPFLLLAQWLVDESPTKIVDRLTIFFDRPLMPKDFFSELLKCLEGKKDC